MKFILVIVCLFVLHIFIPVSVIGQVLAADRSVNWTSAGHHGDMPDYAKHITITDFGAKPDGITPCDSAFNEALKKSFGGVVIIFPSGNYLFHSSITLPDSCIIRGEGASQTRLLFDLSGKESDLIKINGIVSTTHIALENSLRKDDSVIEIAITSPFNVGDYIRLLVQDSLLVTSTWARGSVGQLFCIKSLMPTKISTASHARRTYSLSDSPYLQKLTPRRGVGIECLKIERLDSTAGQTSNVAFDNATDCWVTGVESEHCNFAHIAISSSTNIEISGCYIHHSFGYGGGGRGYGVLAQFTSGECLIENNVFRHLRHSMICQAGANGNVFAYNYSVDPFWTETALPSNSSGDIVLHGNYVFANLFEGNICQNIVIDNSHGINGPGNTFFRNRAELYGIVMNSSPASDAQNFIGNEITNAGFLLGNYIIAGNNQFTFGNNVKGSATPAGTSNLSDVSYYRSKKPTFFTTSMYPTIGYPNEINIGGLPSKDRDVALHSTDCQHWNNSALIVRSKLKSTLLSVYPNPTKGKFSVDSEVKKICIITLLGKKIFEKSILTQTEIDISFVPNGIYILSATMINGDQGNSLLEVVH